MLKRYKIIKNEGDFVSNNMQYIADNQQLMQEWNWNKNNELNLDPNILKYQSNKKVWWICKFNHEWESSIAHRANGRGCPYCSGNRIIIGQTDLQTTHPEIALEWHPTKNKGLRPIDISAGSDKKVWWLCQRSHEWQASVGSRTRGTGCPYCAGVKVLAGFNDISTLRPDLLQEWNYKKNKNLLPTQLCPNSNKKVWWICEQDHEWMSTPNNRSVGKGCPDCAKELQTSFPEQAILFYCKKVTKAENRYTNFGKEIDIYLPEYKVGIEYNGIYYHANKKDVDKQKVDYFKTKDIRIISVNEGAKNCVFEDCIEYEYSKVNQGSLDWIINTIFNMLNIKYSYIDVCSHQIEIWNQYIIGKKENSLAKKYPNIAADWHPTKNGKLKPENVAAHSSKKVWWECSTCKHEWKTTVSHRTTNGSNCPKCATRNIGIKSHKPVYCVELDKIFCSRIEAEKETGAKVSNISKCLKGKIKTTGRHPITGEKLHWKSVDEEQYNIKGEN